MGFGFGLPEAVTIIFAAKILLDIILVLLDVFFDYLLVKDLFFDGHIRWAFAALCVTFLPGVTTSIAMRAETRPTDVMGNLKFLTILLFYPFWICWLAWKTMHEPSKLHMMVHLKSYEGLMEASFQFLIQIIISLCRTAVGHMTVLGIHIPNGYFWWRNFNILLSLMSFIWGVCNYHNLLDKNLGVRSALKVMPYFLVNFLFRSLTIALFFIYIKLPYIIFVFAGFLMLGLINMYLTHKTMNETKEHTSHWLFTCIVGGIISILTPAFGSFYGEGVAGRTVRKYYKANTIATNILLGLSFTGLAIYLNITPDQEEYLNRFPMLGCHCPNHTWKPTEFGFYDFKEDCNFTTKTDFPFLGSKWEVRGKIFKTGQFQNVFCKREPNSSTSLPVNDTKTNVNDTNTNVNHTNTKLPKMSTMPTDATVYLVAQQCLENQSAHRDFNMVMIPLVVLLGILSTLSAFFMKNIGIRYQHEEIEMITEY